MRRGRGSTLWDSMIKKVISRKSLNDCELVEGREEALKYSTKAFLNLFTGLNDFRTRTRKFKVIIDESFCGNWNNTIEEEALMMCVGFCFCYFE